MALAWQLHEQGREFHILEARDRLGGRICSPEVAVGKEAGCFDLGPAWFWTINPRMINLIKFLGLTSFEQFYQGALMFEDAQGQVHKGAGHSSMQGSLRIEGGMQALTRGLAARLPKDRISLKSKVSKISKSENIITTFDNETIEAQNVILALPPRLAANSIIFEPALPTKAIDAMTGIATWMAGHAKFVAVYQKPFWRDKGLSGDAMSRRGPMIEIHDASPKDGGPYALFGFLGTAVEARKAHKEILREACISQLGAIFGPDATKPAAILFQDWAQERATATKSDHQPLMRHPDYGLPQSCENLWDGQLILGSTETALQFGGYLEGALERAETVFHQIVNASGTERR